jgi:transcriptional regulator with XRE-family HTH domain
LEYVMSEPTTLAGLIRRERDINGLSYSDIARRTGLSKAKIGQLADADSRFQVRHETIEKLALGLHLPLVVVQRAALATAGITDADNPRAARIDVLAHLLDELDDDTLVLIEAMLEAAVRVRTRG